jgi:formylglycine-generating enzyme required for sulfatase activity
MTDDPKRSLKVFLCHAHSDEEKVRSLYARLKADSVDVWLDKESLIPGVTWESEIRKAVCESDIVIVCLSKQFNQKGYRQDEVRVALEEARKQPEGEIFIIPARLEECDYLESLKHFHGVDLFEEKGYDRLMHALHKRAEGIGATLQGQKGWLGSAASPVKKTAPKKPEPVVKKPFAQTEKYVTKSPRKRNVKIIVTAGLIILAAILGSLLWDNLSAFVTPLPDEAIDAKGIIMRLVPSGTFKMGGEKYDNEKPIHDVYLGDYYMDVYEVTNAAYKLCVDDGICQLPSNTDKYNASTYAQHPVVYVNWNMAKNYCEWRDARLPTEAEWEKAARSAKAFTYPWGEGIYCSRANYQNSCVGGTTKVGSYKSGKSPYGMYDMAGNVWEWVNDWYDAKYYQSSPSSNPLGPDSGVSHVLRGGSWYNFYVNYARSANRDYKAPYYFNNSIGFRCARSLPWLWFLRPKGD